MAEAFAEFYKRRCQEQTLLLIRSESSARHRALVGICMLSVRAWVETSRIPVLVLHRFRCDHILRLHKPHGLCGNHGSI